MRNKVVIGYTVNVGGIKGEKLYGTLIAANRFMIRMIRAITLNGFDQSVEIEPVYVEEHL
jgi:hypothetical protein